jgi:hypothetical protein
MVSHAANPTVQLLEGGFVRVYFSTRDSKKRSHIGAAIFDLVPKPQLLDLSPEPLVAPGATGLFDDSGVSMGCIVSKEETLLLYYVGWNLGTTVPWRNSIGLAISTDGAKTFKKRSLAPIMDRSSVDPYSLSYPWVLAGPETWRMWYGSNLRWGASERDMDHVIKYAESDDGVNWRREGEISIPLSREGEYAIARPCVMCDNGVFRMWFAHRGDHYRLGYAESPDGSTWNRDLRADLPEISSNGWDSQMVTYPCVFDWKGARYMLYNGNGYGRSGFGIALLA